MSGVYDVAIVGGGFVGGTIGVALADAGLGVLVIDRDAPETVAAPGFDGRSSAIAAAPQRLLDRLGIWRGVAPEACPIEDIRVADGGSPLFLHYGREDVGAPALGFMVENRHLRMAVRDRVRETGGITVMAPAALTGVDADDTGAALTFENYPPVRAGLVIGADGRGSFVREAAGIRLTRRRYGQTGIVCTVAHEHPHHNVAHEHFFPAGPFAILPLTRNRASIVWTERTAVTGQILALSGGPFLEELAERLGDFLGGLEVVGPRWSYPLALQYAETIVGPRLALAGDAAQAMHPIAGQGLNLGLRDAAALAEVIVDARRLGLDIGAPATLARYQRWRRFDSHLMLALTDGLNRLFSNDLPGVRGVRDAGLVAVHRAGPLKTYFMRHAMGEMGDLPRLLKGEAL